MKSKVFIYKQLSQHHNNNKEIQLRIKRSNLFKQSSFCQMVSFLKSALYFQSFVLFRIWLPCLQDYTLTTESSKLFLFLQQLYFQAWAELAQPSKAYLYYMLVRVPSSSRSMLGIQKLNKSYLDHRELKARCVLKNHEI